MSAARLGRSTKAAALVLLALVPVAGTACLVGFGASSVNAGHEPGAELPDGTPVPTEAIETPASYSEPGTIGLGVPAGSGEAVVASASINGIPSAALDAYQRAESVINASDQTCNLRWQLIAAIGRVESDHGRYGGNSLGRDGISRPGIYGIALDGSHDTAEVSDTDAGQYDDDEVWDRAVGPMQFIPSTWNMVGVDADGDGDRNPQDIDDAALASAVYMCSGKDDLSSDAGQRASVFRYNHSRQYVNLVLSIMRVYQEGEYAAVPNNTTSSVRFTPSAGHTQPTTVRTPQAKGSKPNQAADTGSTEPGADTGPDDSGSPNGSDPTKVAHLEGMIKRATQDPMGTATETLTRERSRCLPQGLNLRDC